MRKIWQFKSFEAFIKRHKKRTAGLHTRWEAMAVSPNGWENVAKLLYDIEEWSRCKEKGCSCRSLANMERARLLARAKERA